MFKRNVFKVIPATALAKNPARPKIVMVGAFPPPVHGMAAVNAAVQDALQRAGVIPLKVNVAAPSLERSFIARLGRLPRVLRGLSRLVSQRDLRGAALYMSVSGGLGQLYEIAFLLLARLRGMSVFLHHHSFAYLDKPSGLTRILVRAAGDKAVHVTLSPGMGTRLKDNYGITRVVPVSNAIFFAAAAAGTVRKELKTLGFLSNVAPEKGVFEFLDLIAAANCAGLPVHAKLAGPFQDAEIERQIRMRLATLSSVAYVGPKYGIAKASFYDGIDVLIFPTRYVNEAEPLLLHEAMSRGIPVIVYGRGCIPEIVDSDCGLVIDPALPFVPAALAQIQAWLAEPDKFMAASRAAATRFAQTYTENEARWQVLLAELTDHVIEQAIASAIKDPRSLK